MDTLGRAHMCPGGCEMARNPAQLEGKLKQTQEEHSSAKTVMSEATALWERWAIAFAANWKQNWSKWDSLGFAEESNWLQRLFHHQSMSNTAIPFFLNAEPVALVYTEAGRILLFLPLWFHSSIFCKHMLSFLHVSWYACWIPWGPGGNGKKYDGKKCFVSC